MKTDKTRDRDKHPRMTLSSLPESFKEQFCKEHKSYRTSFCVNYHLDDCPKSCYYAKETLKLEGKVQNDEP